jgi:translation initiation factor IF-3
MKRVDFESRCDFEALISRASEILHADEAVTLTFLFRGSEISNRDFGIKMIKQAIAALARAGRQDGEFKQIGRRLFAKVVPLA